MHIGLQPCGKWAWAWLWSPLNHYIHSSCGHARRCISRTQRTYICNHAYDNPTASKASICESMRKKVLRPRHFTMVDHCQNGPAPQNLSCWVLELSFLSTSNPKHYKANNCPWKQSRSRSWTYLCGCGKMHVQDTRTKEGTKRVPACSSNLRHLLQTVGIQLWNCGHLFGEKKHQRSKGSTPAIGISAVPARHKSESPWGDMAAFVGFTFDTGAMPIVTPLDVVAIPWCTATG